MLLTKDYGLKREMYIILFITRLFITRLSGGLSLVGKKAINNEQYY